MNSPSVSGSCNYVVNVQDDTDQDRMTRKTLIPAFLISENQRPHRTYIRCKFLLSIEFTYLLTFPANFLPGFHHQKRIFFHNRAFAQDAPGTTEISQRAQQGLQIQIGFFELEMILLTFRSVLDA
jgi:hypothetical protein